MASYYRKFIQDFSTICEPINRLLKKNSVFNWTNECQTSFDKIIAVLVSPPLLTYPNFKEKFILETGASDVGLGAVLAQTDSDGTNRPIAYASRTLKDAERNYFTIEKECQAIVWATKHFKPYLYGRENEIQSDHNPLVFMDNMKKKTSRVSRWRYSLVENNYSITYTKGA